MFRNWNFSNLVWTQWIQLTHLTQIDNILCKRYALVKVKITGNFFPGGKTFIPNAGSASRDSQQTLVSSVILVKTIVNISSKVHLAQKHLLNSSRKEVPLSALFRGVQGLRNRCFHKRGLVRALFRVSDWFVLVEVVWIIWVLRGRCYVSMEAEVIKRRKHALLMLMSYNNRLQRDLSCPPPWVVGMLMYPLLFPGPVRTLTRQIESSRARLSRDTLGTQGCACHMRRKDQKLAVYALSVVPECWWWD